MILLSPSLANQTLAAISAIFSWGIEQEIVVANPCRLVRRNVIAWGNVRFWHKAHITVRLIYVPLLGVKRTLKTDALESLS